jgi:hypothetical protein
MQALDRRLNASPSPLLQTDLPVAARADATELAPAAAAAERASSPPKFASAAKMEHLAEARAIRQHRDQVTSA